MTILYEEILDFLFKHQNEKKDLLEEFSSRYSVDAIKSTADELKTDQLIKGEYKSNSFHTSFHKKGGGSKTASYKGKPTFLAKITVKGIQNVQERRLKADPVPTRPHKTNLRFLWYTAIVVGIGTIIALYNAWKKPDDKPEPVVLPVASIDICGIDPSTGKGGFGILYYSTTSSVQTKIYYINVCNSLAPAYDVDVQFVVLSKFKDSNPAISIGPHLGETRGLLLVDTAKLITNAKVRLEFPLRPWGFHDINNVWVLGYGEFTDDKETRHDVYILKKYSYLQNRFVEMPVAPDEQQRVNGWLNDFKTFNIPQKMKPIEPKH